MGLRAFLSLVYPGHAKLRGPAQLGKTSLPSFMASASVFAFWFFFVVVLFFLICRIISLLCDAGVAVCLALRCTDRLMNIKLGAWFLSIANSLGQ